MKMLLLFLSSAVGFLLTLNPAIAAPVKVSCPKIIGDLNTGEYKAAKNNFECFANVSAAKKEGYVVGQSIGDTVSYSGISDQSTSNFRVGRPARMNYSYVGTSNFIVILRNAASGERVEGLVNEIDTISGSISIPDAGLYYLDITGIGSWTINIAPR